MDDAPVSDMGLRPDREWGDGGSGMGHDRNAARMRAVCMYILGYICVY